MECFSPVSLPRKEGRSPADRVSVPCGNCPSCLSRRRSAWAFRLGNQLKTSSTATFLTLTYSDLFIPLVENSEGKWIGTLEKRDLQLYLYKVRQAMRPTKFKYYAVGEYGTKTKRPHYHIILFGIPQEKLYLLHDLWQREKTQLGNTFFGRVNARSINYVAGYIINKRFDSHAKISGVNAPFSWMSKGIGLSYVDQFKQYHHETMSFQATLEDGVKISLPRYYAEKIFTPISREHHASEMRLEISRKHEEQREKIEAQGMDFLSWKELQKSQYKKNMINKSKKNKDL